MWKYGVLLLVLALCGGRPQMDPDECYGIYCDDGGNSTQTQHYDGDVVDGNGTNPLARQLFYRTKPSIRVV